MPSPKNIPKIIMDDPAANRWADQLMAILNPILRNVSGDLSGSIANPLVVGFYGLPLLDGMKTPGVGQAIIFNGLGWTAGVVAAGTVTAVTATAPLSSTGGTAPDISLTGTVPIANGGTNGSATPLAGAVPYGTGTSYAFSAVGASGLPLLSGGSGAPSFAALDLAAAGTLTGVLPINRGGTNGTAVPTAGAIPYGTGTAYAFSLAGSPGQLATSGGAGAITWTTPSASTTGASIGAYRATTTTPDTVALTDYVVDVTTTGSFTVNLPTAGSGVGQAANGRVFVVKNSGGAMVTVTPQGAQTIDGAVSFMIVTQYASFNFLSTGSGWVLV